MSKCKWWIAKMLTDNDVRELVCQRFPKHHIHKNPERKGNEQKEAPVEIQLTFPEIREQEWEEKIFKLEEGKKDTFPINLPL